MNHYIKSLVQVYRCHTCFVADPKLLSSFFIVTILQKNQEIKFNQQDDVQHKKDENKVGLLISQLFSFLNEITLDEGIILLCFYK